MTGFIGERTNRRVALVTDDFRLYHELAPFFEAHGITILGLAPGEAVPDAVAVLLGGPPGDPRSVPLRADKEATWLATVTALDRRGPPRRVVIGVDPGETIGLAVVAGGQVYWWSEAFSPEAAAERIVAWRDGIDPQEWALHVGDGARDVGRAVRRAVRAAWPSIPVSMVSERGSSPSSPATGSRHADAAILIALREP